MTQAPQPDQKKAILVELPEWSKTVVNYDDRLAGWTLTQDRKAQSSIIALGKKLEIRLGLKGLEIESTSFVGRVVVGPLEILVRPKLRGMPLARLLRYAYGLRDIETFDAASVSTTEHGLVDLLAELLAAEVNEIVSRGLASVYVPFDALLAAPRGRIDLQEIGRRGGVREARLPCHYHDRHRNWHLNQIVRTGLEMAARYIRDPDLRRRVHQLAQRLEAVETRSTLSVADVERAERALTRLTSAYSGPLVLIKLICELQGTDIVGRTASDQTLGYLFDMNFFYQRLLSRFFHSNLVGQRIEDEHVIRGVFAYAPGSSPNRRPPAPRPDYALFEAAALRGFLDAKYRDVWQCGLPPDWLYQLGIYALSSPSKTSVLLYSTMSPDAIDEKIDVRAGAKSVLASVLLRPVDLDRLAHLVRPDMSIALAQARRSYAQELTSLDMRTRRSLMTTSAAATSP